MTYLEAAKIIGGIINTGVFAGSITQSALDEAAQALLQYSALRESFDNVCHENAAAVNRADREAEGHRAQTARADELEKALECAKRMLGANPPSMLPGPSPDVLRADLATANQRAKLAESALRRIHADVVRIGPESCETDLRLVVNRVYGAVAAWAGTSKGCDTCAHIECDSVLEPCRSCFDHPNFPSLWTPGKGARRK